jgi:cystathionine beta-lyase
MTSPARARPTLDTVAFPSLERLRQRRSAKWTRHDHDVLPMPVAEMDCFLQPAIAAALHEAVDAGDTGYPGVDPGLIEAFADFSRGRWGWAVDPTQVLVCGDVSVGGITAMKTLMEPGSGLIINTPVYPPFFAWPGAAALKRVEVPLSRHPRGDARQTWRLDLAGIEAAFAAGATGFLLCHPHNPIGAVHPAEDLRAVADLALRYDAIVISDEIHAPLTLPGTRFEPFLTVSDAARQVGVALHSASKAWNLAGLKSAFIVTADPSLAERIESHRDTLLWKAGHFGCIAGEAAYRHGQPWLDDLVRLLADNHRELRADLPRAVPGAAVAPAQAGYLAWIDLRATVFGEDPATELEQHGRLGLEPGHRFGRDIGQGHVRVNLGCHPDVLAEAIRRFARAADAVRAMPS